MSSDTLVAIVGRPNVGKSTLFNRLVEARVAITEAQPGVTRDRHYDLVEWTGRTFTIVDTGGYVTQNPTAYDKAIAQQVDLALAEAALILLVVDGKTGPINADQVLANHLRHLGKPILVAVNKTESHEAALTAPSFHTLGIHSIYPISAIHGTGTGDLLDAVVQAFGKSTAPPEEENALPRIAIVGKPNVGKSTLLNALLDTDRQLVSSQPHTTRDAIDSHYHLFGKKLILTDTAGMRRRSHVKENIEFYAVMRSLRAIDRADVCLILIDAQEGFTAQDQQLVQLAWQKHKGVVILLNKWDTVDQEAHPASTYRTSITQALGSMDDIPILCIAALHKKRIYQALEKALEVYHNRQRRTPTAKLNQAVQQAIARTPPPLTRGRTIEIKYITQLPRSSPTFALFTNYPQHVPDHYKRYLVRQLRTNFTLSGVPVTLIFKKK